MQTYAVKLLSSDGTFWEYDVRVYNHEVQFEANGSWTPVKELSRENLKLVVKAVFGQTAKSLRK